MNLASTSFGSGDSIPKKYTCDGEDISPPLLINDVPEDAKSLLFIMDDPDVPKSIRRDGYWDHWIVYNIPPSTKEIKEGKEPEGVHGKDSAGRGEYMGPCPPNGEHRYFFKIYALDITFNPNNAELTKNALLEGSAGHILAESVLMGVYKRV